MDYEEKYNAALRRAKKLYGEGTITECLGWVFPELEDEDERIKREILELVSISGNGNQYEEIKDWLEKQGEQPTDKVEPKFKVRDWLQYRDAEPFLVEEITEQGYCNGNSCLLFEWEDEIHPWTIQDAKRGDVLVDVYGNIGIFDKCYDFDWTSYCSLGKYGGFQHFKVEHENEKTYPASKEQRDLFFSKIKEEGWEWDSENKELKKNLLNNLNKRWELIITLSKNL